MRRAVAEIEDTLPACAAVPINPSREAEGVVRGHIRRERDDRICPIKQERLPAMAIGIAGTAGSDPVVGVAGRIESVGIKVELGETTRPIVLKRLDIAN